MGFKKLSTFTNVQNCLEREFIGVETLQLLQLNQSIFLSWGTSKIMIVGQNKGEKEYIKGLILKVSANYHKQFILITLGFEDLYNVYLMNIRHEVIEECKGIYFDELVNVIDERIEKRADYKF